MSDQLHCSSPHFPGLRLLLCCPGGHTSEILRLVGSLSAAFSPRYYVVADTDRMSEDKISTFEEAKGRSESQVQTCPFFKYENGFYVTKLYL